MENLQRLPALSAQAHTLSISMHPRTTTVSWHSIQFASYCLMKTRHEEHHSHQLPVVPGSAMITATARASLPAPCAALDRLQLQGELE